MVKDVERLDAELKADSLSNWECLVEGNIERNFFWSSNIARMRISEFTPSGRLERCWTEIGLMSQIRFAITGMRNWRDFVGMRGQPGVARSKSWIDGKTALKNGEA